MNFIYSKYSNYSSNIVEAEERPKSLVKRIVISVSIFAIIFCSTFLFVAKQNKAEASPFGLNNNYQDILEQNEKLANVAPIPVDSITIRQSSGDKRVIALYTIFQKYRSPMASIRVAKAFVDGADRNGFSDRWQLLPAISGIESGFGRMTPQKKGKPSYNGWGWGGPGHWVYFTSWEDAATKISAGVAKGYGLANLTPEKMMRSYCPPCYASGGKWAIGVNGYIKEINNIWKSL